MQIVLVEPQIPQNTGSIARTCAATRTPLHLVGKLGFEISERRVKRAGLDYWPHVELHQHKSWADYLKTVAPTRMWFFSKFATRLYHSVDYELGDALVFGSETEGLGQEFLGAFPAEQALRIPIECEAVRSLNLSNAVAVALYEAKRQFAAGGHKQSEPSLREIARINSQAL